MCEWFGGYGYGNLPDLLVTLFSMYKLPGLRGIHGAGSMGRSSKQACTQPQQQLCCYICGGGSIGTKPLSIVEHRGTYGVWRLQGMQ